MQPTRKEVFSTPMFRGKNADTELIPPTYQLQNVVPLLNRLFTNYQIYLNWILFLKKKLDEHELHDNYGQIFDT